MSRQDVLSESTPITVGLMIVFIGGVIWLSNMHFRTDANAKAVVELTAEQKAYNINMQKVNERLARIEGALGLKEMPDGKPGR